MSKDIVKDSIKCLANMEIEETTYQVARNVVLEEIERLNNIIKEAREEMKNAKYISVEDEYHIIKHEKKLNEILDKVGSDKE